MDRKWIAKYGGIVIGGLYGLILRFIYGFRADYDTDYYKFLKSWDADYPYLEYKAWNSIDIFSLTFIWVVPAVISIIPFIFSINEKLNDKGIRLIRPLLSIFSFFVFCFVTSIEQPICIIIMALPFLFVCVITYYLFGWLFKKYKGRKGLYSILILPFLTSYLENYLPIQIPSASFKTTTTVIIKATKNSIWQNIIRVDSIKNEEYPTGILNLAGIPKPLFAELNNDTLGGTRIGHFEGGLMFKEKIISIENNKSISFDIKIIPSNKSKTIFESHMLNDKHFKFLNATYRLTEIDQNTVELSLTTNYFLRTKMNFYGNFWGNILLQDFQHRLLEVIKSRCENKTSHQHGFVASGGGRK
jgi:hypothetical protein